MNRINWQEEVRDHILAALENHPRGRFPNIRSVWYYLWSAVHAIPGTEYTYKKTDDLLVKMRKQGLIPFGRFQVERGRDGYGGALSAEPSSLVESIIGQLIKLPKGYDLPRQFGQPCVIEVWVEKKGLLPTFEAICRSYDIKVRSPEGFSPWEFVYHVVTDLEDYIAERSTREIVILYFGDQDPSGEMIYESIKGQLDFFQVAHKSRRVGLTVDQIVEYGLPDMPVDAATLKKIRRDSRYRKYVTRYGREIFCELDSFISLAYDGFTRTLTEAVEMLIDPYASKETEILGQAMRTALHNAVTPDQELIGELTKRIIDRYEDNRPKD